MVGEEPAGFLTHKEHLVTTPDDTLWDRDPHTGAKHQVLRGYLRAWFPILLQSEFFDSLTVFEGYAGPGEYTAGEEGSPILALRALLDSPELVATGKPVRFAFLEDREDRVRHLSDLITRKFGRLPTHVTIEVRRGRCETEALPFLGEVGAWGYPVFANLDPFDAYVPLPVVERLAQNEASEALVSFMSDRLRRVARMERIRQGDEMFGSSSWREVQHLATPEEKEAFLVESYREVLTRAGLSKIAGFKLIDEGGRRFWLLHATRHMLGLRRMKDAMWKVDPVNGVRFRDPRDPAQGTLEFATQWKPDLGPLERLVAKYLREAGRVMVEDVRQFTLTETSYREPHATEVLRSLVKCGKIGRHPAQGQITKETSVWYISDVDDRLFE